MAAMIETSSKSSSALLARGIFLVLILAGLCLAVFGLISPSGEFDLSSLLSGPYFYRAVALQVLALTLFIAAWFVLLNSSGQAQISFFESAAHIGITLLGKYLPGKVWGLLGRAYLLKTKRYSTSDAANLLLADQFITFYTGLAVGGLALSAIYSETMFLLSCAVFVLISILIVNIYPKLIAWLLTKLANVFRRLSDLKEQSRDISSSVSRSGLAMSVTVYFIHWLAISFVLVLLFYPALQEDIMLNSLLLFAAIPIAMLTGFVAVWAPAGIGVREGVIVGILAFNLPLDLAASIAVVYRLICVLNDLATGIIALVYFGKSGLQVPNSI